MVPEMNQGELPDQLSFKDMEIPYNLEIFGSEK